MKSSNRGKWAFMLLLVGVIVLAVLWRKRQKQKRRQQRAGGIPAVVSRVPDGALPLRGEPLAWNGVNRFPLWEEAPQKGAETDWRAVRLAHDGRALHVMLTLAYPVQARAPEGKGTLIVGQIMMDTDRDASTGIPLGSEEGAPGIDRQITLIGTRREASDPLCVGYYVQKCQRDQGCETLGERVTTCSSPGKVGYEDEHLAFAVPFSKLGLQLPVEIIFAFEPLAGSGTKLYRLSVR